jgi:hypothetical protein
MSKKQDKQSLAARQLSTMLANQSLIFAPPNSGQGRYGQSLVDSGQQMTAAQEQYIAEKKAKEKEKKKGLGSILGTAGAVAAAPFTGGASLAFAPAASQLGGSIASGDMTGAGQALASGIGQYGASKLAAPAATSQAPPVTMPDMGGNGVLSTANQIPSPSLPSSYSDLVTPGSMAPPQPGMVWDANLKKWVFSPQFGV